MQLFRVLSVLVIIFLILSGVYYFLSFGNNGKLAYSADEFINYQILTDREIKNAPRITKNFHFESLSGDGYSPSNSIVFSGAESIKPLERYLMSLGYKRENRKLGENIVWSQSELRGRNIFYLSYDPFSKEAVLTKVLTQ